MVPSYQLFLSHPVSSIASYLYSAFNFFINHTFSVSQIEDVFFNFCALMRQILNLLQKVAKIYLLERLLELQLGLHSSLSLFYASYGGRAALVESTT